MAGPGGDEVGRVSIRVVPDSSGFRSELRRELDAIESSMKVEIPVSADTSALRREVRAATSSLERSDIDLDVGADTSSALAETRAFAARTEALKPDIDVDADTAGAMTKALAATSAINGLSATIKVEVEPPEMPELPDVPKVAEALAPVTDTFKSLLEAGAKLPGMFGSVVGALGSMWEIGSKVFTVTSGLVEKFTSMGTGVARFAGGLATGALAAVTMFLSLSKLGAQASVVLVALGAMTYAAGALGAVVSGLPALLFATAAAGGAVALGMDGIKRAYESGLKPALDKLKEQVSATFEKSLAPVMKDISGLLPKLSGGFQAVAQTTSVFIGELAEIFTSVEGVENLNKVLGGTQGFIEAITPGVKSMITEMLRAAAVQEVYKILGDIISTITNRVGELFRKFSEGGGTSLMVRSLASLNAVLDSALGAFNALVVGATEFFTYAGPGVKDAFDSIKRVIEKINFRHLGESFGIFARAVGSFFESIPQSTWDALVNAVRDLALKVKELTEDPRMQEFFNGLVFIIPLAITAFTDFLGMLRAVVNFVAEGFSRAKQGVTDFINEVKAVGEGLAAAWDWIKQKSYELSGAVLIAWAQIKNWISTKITEILGTIRIKWAEIKAAISAKITEILGTIRIKWAEIKNAVSAKITEIKTAVVTKWNEIRNSVTQAGSRIVESVRNAWNRAKEAVRNGVNAAVNFVRQLPSKAKAALGNLGSYLLASGKALLKGFIDGIKAGFRAAANAVRSGLANIRSYFPFSPAEKGPFSGRGWVLYSGQTLMPAFAAGIRKGTPTALRAIETAVEQTRAVLENAQYDRLGRDHAADYARNFAARLEGSRAVIAAEAATTAAPAPAGGPGGGKGERRLSDDDLRALATVMAETFHEGFRFDPEGIARATRRGDRVLQRR